MSDSHGMGHKLEFSTYLKVFIGLLVLTVVTVYVSHFNFGVFNDAIALAVATVKTSLVVLYFMHGKFEGKLIWAFLYYPLIVLATLIAALFIDYGTQPRIYVENEVNTKFTQGTKYAKDDAHGGAYESGAAESGDAAAEAAAAETASPSGEPAAAPEAEAVTASASAWGPLTGDAAAGKAKAKVLCIACHIIDGAGNALPGAPPFSESANLERINPEYLRKWLKNPQAVKPGTLMPLLPLTDEEIENMIAYLATYQN